MIKDVPEQSPLLKISIPKLNEDFILRLPIHIMSAMSPVDQMTEELFEKNWQDLTRRPSNFQKADCILKNPAPKEIPIPAVIK